MSVLRKDNNEAVVGGSPPESDMFHAAASGARDWLSLTLKKARKPLITDKHGLSVLHIAALHGHLDCMELLLAGGYADVNVSCPHGRRPLHMMLTAQSQPNTHAGLIYLLEHGAHISVSTDEGLTPLHQAAAEGLTDCTETLVSERCHVEERQRAADEEKQTSAQSQTGAAHDDQEQRKVCQCAGSASSGSVWKSHELTLD
ncbi:ankyrin repeat domain-containing protein 53 isoform X2 [Danio rerio]|uniref:Ankyrin repeat domain-containing protein 53 isoform X2 n=1 Tax=Danio rerio TaxID=7955 RepID=A0AC58G330_DANRE